MAEAGEVRADCAVVDQGAVRCRPAPGAAARPRPGAPGPAPATRARPGRTDRLAGPGHRAPHLVTPTVRSPIGAPALEVIACFERNARREKKASLPSPVDLRRTNGQDWRAPLS